MNETMLFKYGLAFFAGVASSAVCLSFVTQSKLRWLAGFFLTAFGTLALIGLDAYVVEPNWIQTEHVVIRDAPLARSLGGLKIIQISDIHLTRGITNREKDLIEKINALKPDFIFITGDFLDDLTQVDSAVELIRALHAKIGIWGVPGNTDHISIDGRALASALAPGGIQFLINEAQRVQTAVGKYFWLVGVDENVYHRADLSQALARVPPGSPVLLLAHAPYIFEQAAERNINLVLAGHTHGGQVGIPFLVRLSDYANRTPYMRGLFRKGSTKLYVNRGIGMKTLPIRFLCRPEITVLEIKP